MMIVKEALIESQLKGRGVLHFCCRIFYTKQEQRKKPRTHAPAHNILFDKQVRGGSARLGD